MVGGEVVGRVGLDDVGAELGRLAHERDDAIGAPSTAVSRLRRAP
jgi:hypothetical protein